MKKLNEDKIHMKEVPKIVLYTYCPICNKEIVSTSATQLEYNLNVHIDTQHSNKKKVDVPAN